MKLLKPAIAILFVLLALGFYLVWPAPDARIALANRAIGISVGMVTTEQSPYTPGQEVVSNRTQNSKTTYLEPNRYAYDGSTQAVHYRGPGGNWTDIDNIITPGTLPNIYQMVQADYQVYVTQLTFNQGQILRYQVSSDSVAMQPMNLDYTNNLSQIQQIASPQAINPVVTNPPVNLLPNSPIGHAGLIKWTGAYGSGVELQWQAQPTRLAKLLIVNSRSNLPNASAFIINGGNPMLRLSLIFTPSANLNIYVDGTLWDRSTTRTTFSSIEFRNGLGQTQFGFTPLMYWDSSGLPAQQSGATLRRAGQNLYISIAIPYSYVQSAVYPLYIDATLDVQVGASTSDASWFEGNSVFTNSATSVYVAGYIDATYQRANSLARFTGLSAANGATINAGTYLSFYSDLARSAGTPDTSISAIDSDNAAAPTTYAGAEGATRTTSTAAWSPIGAWSSGVWYNSPDVNGPLQELSNSSYLASGVAVMMLDDTGGGATGEYRRAASYDGNTTGAPKLHVDYTLSTAITNTPSTWAIGVIIESTTYWASGSAPTFPLDDGECTYTVTNTGGVSINITVKATNFTGGTTWTLGTPASNVIRMKAGVSGDANEGAMVTLTTSDQAFISSLAASGTKKWELKIDSPTSWTDESNQKNGTDELTATAA